MLMGAARTSHWLNVCREAGYLGRGEGMVAVGFREEAVEVEVKEEAVLALE